MSKQISQLLCHEHAFNRRIGDVDAQARHGRTAARPRRVVNTDAYGKAVLWIRSNPTQYKRLIRKLYGVWMAGNGNTCNPIHEAIAMLRYQSGAPQTCANMREMMSVAACICGEIKEEHPQLFA